MRYLKLASDKNPTTDFIELNDFNGFLCTSFQSIGINRKLEFLAIKNRQFVVSNDVEFKKYSLVIEILTKYSEYEAKHRQLITFLDRNKKDGFRLYYRPYNGMDLRYCLCDIISSTKTEKMQPITLTLSQSSLWLGKQKIGKTSQNSENEGNIFGFFDDENGYYSASFLQDKDIPDYYCIEFFRNITTEAIIENNSYNEIPLNIKIKGPCVNPTVSVFRKNEKTPVRKLEINQRVDSGQYIDIISNIGKNGVWLVNQNGERTLYNEFVNNEYGSPYFYIDNGEYVIRVADSSNNACEIEILYQEEFSE